MDKLIILLKRIPWARLATIPHVRQFALQYPGVTLLLVLLLSGLGIFGLDAGVAWYQGL